MTLDTIILLVGLVAAVYMAWNIGANDVANAMATAVGAKAITLKQAVIIAAILDLIGAAFIGSHVAQTIRKGIVHPDVLGDPTVVMIGLLSALLAASFWVFFATWSRLPVSTTHAVVGAMLGFGLITGGPSVVNWAKTSEIVVCWILSPFFSGILAYFIYKVIYRNILSKENMFFHAVRLSPYFVGITFFVMFLSLFLKTPLGEKVGFGTGESVAAALIIGFLWGILGRWFIKTFITSSGLKGVEEAFRRIQILTSCYVSLAHGANDVANAMGPFAGIYFIVTRHTIGPEIPIPFYLLALGGMMIAFGILTWGYRVIGTVGSRITTLTNTRGFSVDFGTATSVLLASKMGLPVSTTHAAVGAVIGVGLARGFEAVDFRVVWKILLYWVITLPAAAICCMIIFKFINLLI